MSRARRGAGAQREYGAQRRGGAVGEKAGLGLENQGIICGTVWVGTWEGYFRRILGVVMGLNGVRIGVK